VTVLCRVCKSAPPCWAGLPRLMCVEITPPAPVGQSLHPALLVTVEDLVAGLAGDSELPAKVGYRLAG